MDQIISPEQVATIVRQAAGGPASQGRRIPFPERVQRRILAGLCSLQQGNGRLTLRSRRRRRARCPIAKSGRLQVTSSRQSNALQSIPLETAARDRICVHWNSPENTFPFLCSVAAARVEQP